MIVFVVPSLGTLDSTLVIKVLAATQFLVGPMSAVVAAVPVTAKARAALQRLTEIEASLAQATRSGSDYDPAVSFADFRRIELAGVRFRYDGEDRGFEIGPVDITFERGETVFLIGGNGSGKSTLIRLLLGLYRPQEGEIRVDGVPVTERNLEAYRALFSPVFSDNHLFQHLFGIPVVSAEKARELLELLELVGKASIEGRSFSTLRLSGGQRKRLALLVSILEKRPVVVLDEWAADQDPVFRRKFYDEIVGHLVAAGKTVIAATHDDLYFDRAARIVALRDGAIESDSSTDRPTDDDGRPS